MEARANRTCQPYGATHSLGHPLTPSPGKASGTSHMVTLLKLLFQSMSVDFVLSSCHGLCFLPTRQATDAKKTTKFSTSCMLTTRMVTVRMIMLM